MNRPTGRRPVGLEMVKVEAAAPSAKRLPNAGAAQPPPRCFVEVASNRPTITRPGAVGKEIGPASAPIEPAGIRLYGIQR